ncbi:DUF2232 domain-containing protein [Paenibacillus sp. FSL K6-1230]|uniref:DUF2232 domain-containing protein n=1 Tax=Paenibacillus sp. FSL K6-1230 TaxID=2921603 RepID=UPI00039B255C
MKSRMTSAVWVVIYVLLLLSLLTPLRLITSFFLIVPAAVLYALLPIRQFLLYIVGVAVVALIASPVLLLSMLYFLIPGLLMGMAYKKKAPALQALMTGTGVMVAMLLLLLLISTTLFQFDLSGYIREIVNQMVAPLQDMTNNNPLTSINWTDQDTKEVADATVAMVPYALILTSFLMALITHVVTRPLLTAAGMDVPKMKPAREWRMPRALIWYYLLAVLIEWIAYGSSGGWATIIAANLIPLINICFVIQTIGFFFFLTHVRRWNPAISFLLSALVLLIHPLRIIGIIDLAFPLREAITKSKR